MFGPLVAEVVVAVTPTPPKVVPERLTVTPPRPTSPGPNEWFPLASMYTVPESDDGQDTWLPPLSLSMNRFSPW